MCSPTSASCCHQYSSPSILSVLTEDLLVLVNGKLDSGSDRKTWRLVCKDFLRVDSLTRRCLRVLRVEFLPVLVQKFANIEILDLSVCPRIDNATVSLLLSSCLIEPAEQQDLAYRQGAGQQKDTSGREEYSMWTRKVKALNLSRATGLRWSGLEMLIKACVNLSSVDVSYCCGFGDREAEALSYGKSLREVKMDKCLKLSDVGLAKVAVGCGERLVKVSLKWCMEISDLGLDLLCKKCANLKYLDISYLKVTNESLRSIASLLKLEVLVMVGCTMVSNDGLKFLKNGCPLLQEIDVSRCDCISSSGLVHVIRGHSRLVKIIAGYCLSKLSPTLVHCMMGLKNLDTIIIDGAWVSDTIRQTIGSNCKSLVQIGLSKCIGVTNESVELLVSGCANLKILNLTCCNSITDVAICGIVDSCRNLVCLKLESCNSISQKSLVHIGSHCLLLEELDLTDCCGINDRALKGLSRCSRLACLKLGICTNITDEGLFHVASICSKLQELDLYRCTGIGDDSLKALSNGCKMLKKLNLSYCNRITDRGMKFLGHLEELYDLEMRGLGKITSTGLKAFIVRCKKLADLDLKHCENIDDSGFWALAHYSQNLRQINLSYCAVSDMALCMVMANLSRLQDVKLVHLEKVTVDGFELALRLCCARIKKVKLGADLRFLLSPEILEILHARGCQIRWD